MSASSPFATLPASKLRVLIAEDYEWARVGIRLSIEQKSNRCQIVGEAQNGREAVEMARTLSPDVVLMDVHMPVMDGIAATEQIKADSPEIKLLMLTSYQDMKRVKDALHAGADGYCLKDIAIERLLQVIEMVSNGAIWLDPCVSGILTQITQMPQESDRKWDNQSIQSAASSDMATAALTRREQEVLEWMTLGKSNKEIAQALYISNHTVKIHVSHIIQKLAVDDRTQVVIKALREGLVQPRTPTAV